MTVVAIENPRISDLVKYEDDLGRNGVTRKDTAVITFGNDQTLTLGSVLGQITATGKWVASDPDASDGSEVAKGLFLYGAASNGLLDQTKVTATGDQTCIILSPAEGAYAVVSEGKLVFDVAHDAGQTATAISELAAAGIQTKTTA